MKIKILLTLAILIIAGCTTDRFALVDTKTGSEIGPFLFRNGSNVHIGDKRYKIKHLSSRNEYLLNRMKTQIIPEVEFREANITDVLSFCREIEIIVDTDEYMTNPRIDVRLVVPKKELDKIPPITFSAQFISLYNIMETMAELTGLDFVVEDGQAWLKYKK